MVKTYSFLSGFVLRMIIGNAAAAAVLFLLGFGAAFSMLNMLTTYIAVLWVVLKLLQAHFPEKTLDIPYTAGTRRKMKIGLIVSVVVSVGLLALNIPGFFSPNYSPMHEVSVSGPFFSDLRLSSALSPLTFLPVAVVLLLANGYVRWFYHLARVRRIRVEEPQARAVEESPR